VRDMWSRCLLRLATVASARRAAARAFLLLGGKRCGVIEYPLRSRMLMGEALCALYGSSWGGSLCDG